MTNDLLKTIEGVLREEDVLNESVNKSEYSEVSKAINTIYGSFSPTSSFSKSLVKLDSAYAADVKKIREHIVAIDNIWQDLRSELDSMN